MLIVLGGLPGTGKTTIGRALAAQKSATYIRIDEIEHALRVQAQLNRDIGPAGYIVAQAIAASNLRIGNWVVADCVNPVPESRLAWRNLAGLAGQAILEVELICSDIREHQRRIESRVADIPGFKLPSWQSVQAHEYAAWTQPRLVLDTAILSPPEALNAIQASITTLSSSYVRKH